MIKVGRVSLLASHTLLGYLQARVAAGDHLYLTVASSSLTVAVVRRLRAAALYLRLVILDSTEVYRTLDANTTRRAQNYPFDTKASYDSNLTHICRRTSLLLATDERSSTNPHSSATFPNFHFTKSRTERDNHTFP